MITTTRLLSDFEPPKELRRTWQNLIENEYEVIQAVDRVLQAKWIDVCEHDSMMLEGATRNDVQNIIENMEQAARAEKTSLNESQKLTEVAPAIAATAALFGIFARRQMMRLLLPIIVRGGGRGLKHTIGHLLTGGRGFRGALERMALVDMARDFFKDSENEEKARSELERIAAQSNDMIATRVERSVSSFEHDLASVGQNNLEGFQQTYENLIERLLQMGLDRSVLRALNKYFDIDDDEKADVALACGLLFVLIQHASQRPELIELLNKAVDEIDRDDIEDFADDLKKRIDLSFLSERLKKSSLNKLIERIEPGYAHNPPQSLGERLLIETYGCGHRQLRDALYEHYSAADADRAFERICLKLDQMASTAEVSGKQG